MLFSLFFINQNVNVQTKKIKGIQNAQHTCVLKHTNGKEGIIVFF